MARPSARWTRRALLATAPGAAACARSASARPVLPDLQPVTTEGGPRLFLAVELIRLARVTALERGIDVSACQWYVSPLGALFGDHWGWCEDFQILPEASPGFLLMTTRFEAQMTGGFGRLVILPPLPARLDAHGQPMALEESGEGLVVQLGQARVRVRPGQEAELGAGPALIEAPVDTGHFEPGFREPIPAHVTYRLKNYGWIESRRIAGRGG